jgi:hypothetical protein
VQTFITSLESSGYAAYSKEREGWGKTQGLHYLGLFRVVDEYQRQWLFRNHSIGTGCLHANWVPNYSCTLLVQRFVDIKQNIILILAVNDVREFSEWVGHIHC